MTQETSTVKDYVVKLKIGTVAVITTVMVSSLVGVGIGYEKIQARLRHLDAKTGLYQQQFDNLETRVSSNENLISGNYRELTTILKAMSANIVEIKDRLK